METKFHASPPQRAPTTTSYMSAMRRGGVSFRSPPPPPPPITETEDQNVKENLSLDSNKFNKIQIQPSKSHQKCPTPETTRAVTQLLKRAQSVLDFFQHSTTVEESESPTTIAVVHQQQQSFSSIANQTSHNNSILVQNVRNYVHALVSAEHASPSEPAEELQRQIIETTKSLHQQVIAIQFPLPTQSVYQSTKATTTTTATTTIAAPSPSQRRTRKREMRERMKHIIDTLRPVIEQQKIQRKKENLDIQQRTGVTWGNSNDVKYRDTTTKKEVHANEYTRRYFELYLTARTEQNVRNAQAKNQTNHKNQISEKSENEENENKKTTETTTPPPPTTTTTTFSLQSDIEAAELKCWQSIELAMQQLEHQKVQLRKKWSSTTPPSPPQVFRVLSPGKKIQRKVLVPKVVTVVSPGKKIRRRSEPVQDDSAATETIKAVSPGKRIRSRSEPVALEESVIEIITAVSPGKKIQTKSATVTSGTEVDKEQIERRRRRRERRKRRASIVLEVPTLFEEEEEEEEEEQ